jgi:uncharacterized protein
MHEIADVVLDKREQILELARRHGVRNVRVFGSAVRGELRADSDVDFLVELEPGRSLLDRIGFIQDLEDLFGRNIDVVNQRVLKPPWQDRILEDALPL